MLTYQEQQFFRERYESLVYSETAQNLFSYVVYPLSKKKPQIRGPQENYKDYDKNDIRQLIVNNQIVVPGPSQFDNLVNIIKVTCERCFPTLIDTYMNNGCFSAYNMKPPLDSSKVCTLRLTEKLKDLWKLK